VSRAGVALLLAAMVASTHAATRPYEDFDPAVHSDLELDGLDPQVPPLGFAIDASEKRVTNPDDRSEQSWRFRAGLAKPRYVRKGDRLYAELPSLRGSRPLDRHLYDLNRIPSPDDVPKPISRSRFDATHLVILAPYDVERDAHRVEVYLGDQERDWFALPETSKVSAHARKLAELRKAHDGLGRAPTWDETAALIEALRRDRALLYDLYVETFGRFERKPGPERR